jgi:hypothetical protein
MRSKNSTSAGTIRNRLYRHVGRLLALKDAVDVTGRAGRNVDFCLELRLIARGRAQASPDNAGSATAGHLSSRQPRSIPWTGIIDRSRSKIFCPKRSTDPSFETTHAKETAFHSGPVPQLVADHVVLRAPLTPAAAFTGAWHCVHTAIFTVVGRCFSAHYAGL